MKRKIGIAALIAVVAILVLMFSTTLTANAETMTTWSSVSGKFGEVTYGNPANDFWVGTDDSGYMFYQTEATHPYQAVTDAKYYIDGFKFTVKLAVADGTFNEGDVYYIGLSNISQGMMMAGIRFLYTSGSFEMHYVSAGLNLDGKDFSEYADINKVNEGENVTIEFIVDSNNNLQIWSNGHYAFTTGQYPSFNGLADYTFPSDDNGYYGYFNVSNNYYAASAENVNNRITFVALEDKDFSKETAPDNLDTTIAQAERKTWSSLSGGVYSSTKYGDISYGNPSQDFWIGEDKNGNLIYDTEAGHSYNALSGLKAYVNGFKMKFMIQSLDETLIPGASIYIGLSNSPMGLTMAAIKLIYNGKYFEMEYSSADVTNLDGNEFSTYEGINRLWLGQTIEIEYKQDADCNLQIWINGCYVFTTGQYPSFNGLADYTFPSDDNGYYGYLSVENGTIGTASHNRITFLELSAEVTVEEEYEYESENTLADTTIKQTFSSGAFENVTYTNLLANDYWFGRDSYGRLFYETEVSKPFTALSSMKEYVDGFKMTFMFQKTAEDYADGSYWFIGLASSSQSLPLASVYLIWRADKEYFEIYYRAAALVNGDGASLDSYSKDLHNLHLGEKITIQFIQDADCNLQIWMNGIYTFTTGYYPSFNGLTDYTFPSDNGGYYGYLSIINSCVLSEVNGCGSRLTFAEISGNGFTSGISNIVVYDNIKTYPQGIEKGFVVGDFTSGIASTGAVKGKEKYVSTNAFSVLYTDSVILNATSISLIASHSSYGDVPAYAINYLKEKNLSEKFAVRFVANGTAKADVYVNETKLGTVKFDWTNRFATSVINVGLFINADNSVVLTVDSNIYVLAEELADTITSFDKNSDGKYIGYIELVNEVGATGFGINELVTDGNAVQKKIAKTIISTIADVDVTFGEEFTNPYNKVEVEFYDGTKEEMNVIWNIGSLNTSFATSYKITGYFESVDSSYYISESLIELLTFNVNVGYAEGFVKYGTNDYNTSDSIWYNCGGGANDFLYKNNGDGTYTIVSDGYKGGQYMPASNVYRDIDGYTFNYSNKIHSNSNMLIVMILPEPKHPVEFGTTFMGFVINSEKNGLFYIDFYSTAGQTEAYLADSEGRLYRTLDGAFTENSFSFEIEEKEGVRYVKYFMTINGTRYAIVNSDGNDNTVNSAYLTNYINDRMYIALWNEAGYSELTFSEKYNKYIVSYEKPADVIVDFGSESGLLEEVDLTLNNGEKVTGTITYSEGYNALVAGTYRLIGTVSYNGETILGNGVSIFDGISSEFIVSVTVREEVKKIVSFEKVADKTIEIGEHYNLPEKVTVDVYGEYTKETVNIEVSVVWTGTVNVLIEGSYILTAQPVGNYEIDESIADNIKVQIIVVAEKESQPSRSSCASSVETPLLAGIIVLFVCFIIFRKKKIV